MKNKILIQREINKILNQQVIDKSLISKFNIYQLICQKLNYLQFDCNQFSKQSLYQYRLGKKLNIFNKFNIQLEGKDQLLYRKIKVDCDLQIMPKTDRHPQIILTFTFYFKFTDRQTHTKTILYIYDGDDKWRIAV